MQVYLLFTVKIEGVVWHFYGKMGFQFGLIVFLNFTLMLLLMVVLMRFEDLQVPMVSWTQMHVMRLGTCFACLIRSHTYLGYAWEILTKFSSLMKNEGVGCAFMVRCRLSGMFWILVVNRHGYVVWERLDRGVANMIG